MAQEKKEGLLSKLFGHKKSGCCNMKIEEVTEEKAKDADKKAPKAPQRSCCCGAQPAKQSIK